MPSFKGQAEYSVDSKGRVAIPAKMRNAMNPEAQGGFTITRGMERCIFLHPADKWVKIEEDMRQQNMYNRQARNFVRQLTRWADDVTLDAQGRIRIPDNLRELAGITDQALIIGALDYIEIWSPEVFNELLNEETEDYETLAESVMGHTL
ncbi:MAG: division/cell wall cluster transcriptional repressor MraZ [Bacteroidota bacterium]